ncbi:MAG: restriction endonuclease subunit S [Spirochaetaceae bacterium]|nr:restriction endonuclease subunit S [Spirochaetaceae bacterium]
MVKQGYKQTEIGVIPEDWSCAKIEDIATISMCKRIFADQTTENGDIPFYKIGTFGKEADAYISVALYNEYRNKFSFPKKGDVLISAAGTLGRTVVYDGKEAYFQDSNIVWLDIDKNVLCNEYLNHYYRVIKWASSEGSTIARLYNGIIYATNIALPPIEEQKRIAEALSDVDSMISSLEKLIAKKKAVKQSAMQELLMGKKRLPGFTDEWEIKTLKEISHEIVDGPFGSDLKKEHYTTERQVRIIQLSNIGESGWNDENTKYTTFAHAYELIRCIVQPQAVLIAKMMPAGRAILCPNNEKGYILGSDVVKLIPNDDIDRKYLIYATKSQFYLDQIADDTQGSTRSRTSVSKLRKTSILFPPKSEQTAIASILSDMDNEIEALEQKLAKTRQLKQGMMQQLLTGKIRFTGKDEDIPRKRTLHSANIYFKRAVLAAEIASRLYQESTFGHVKMEKLLFLTEKLCDIDLNSNYHRDAAGPYDNRALRSIDSQLKKQKWFDVVTIDRARRYIPMEKSGTHSEYFKRYYNHILPTFNFIISTFQKMNTEQCEIVATLYSAWEDFLLDGCVPNDSMIVEEVLTNWHNSKKRISQERWESALNWMRQKNIIPKQRGSM